MSRKLVWKHESSVITEIPGMVWGCLIDGARYSNEDDDFLTVKVEKGKLSFPGLRWGGYRFEENLHDRVVSIIKDSVECEVVCEKENYSEIRAKLN